jgi:hypothetical protein
MMSTSPVTRPARFFNVQLSPRDAWLGATAAASFNMLGMWIEVAIVRKLGVPVTAPIVSSLVGLALLVVLYVWRHAPSVRWASVLYLINTSSVIAALLWTNPQFAVSVAYWDSFQATKLGCLVAALVAPGFWVGVVSILAHCLTAVAQFEFFFPPEVKAKIPAEPWPLIAFGLGGLFALAYRFRRFQLEQDVARIQAQNLALKRLAGAFLNIRDLMNTPIQVIDLSVDLMRKSNEPFDLNLDRIERSVASLKEINAVLVQHEQEIEWESRLP